MGRRKFTRVLIWLALASVLSAAWEAGALAQPDDRRRGQCETERDEQCCVPDQEPDDEQGLPEDCPESSGRRHQDGDGLQA